MVCVDHGGDYERGDGSAEAVESVHETEDFICVSQVAGPGVPTGVEETVAETCQDEDAHDGGIGRVVGEDDVGNEAGSDAEDGDAAAAKAEVDGVGGESGDGVAGEGSEEDEGDDGVVEVVVGFH